MSQYIYLPNEIFIDLKRHISNSSQIAFAYSYVYLITYLYRYCKFIDDNGERMTQENIKEYLGYSPKNKKVDYIIKKGGVLDNIFYTETTTNYPVQYLINEYDSITFDTIDNYKNIIKNLNDRNFKIKIPLKAFHRTQLDYNENILTGTFYEVENTHRIQFSLFQSIIKDKSLGVVAFYIYGYLKHKNDIFKSGYQRSFEKMAGEIAVSERTIRKYISLLESAGLIFVEHKLFDTSIPIDDREANIYNVV